MSEVRPSSVTRWSVLALGLVVAALVGVGVGPYLERERALASEAGLAVAPRSVAVVRAAAGAPGQELTLPGSALPFQSTVVYARAPGFVREVLADLGDVVRAGQVLAVIEAPELGDDRRRAEARLREAEDNVTLARVAAEREGRLAAEGASSKQRSDEATARLNSAVGAVQTSRAELARVETMIGLQRVTAPFAGTIVRRSVDRGALVSGGGGAGATSLFELADVTALRIFVDVPQALASGVKVGAVARVFAAGGPSEGVEGKVVRTAGALDARTRNLRTELHVPEAGGILAGGYVSVKLTVARAAAPVRVPATALIVGKDANRIAVVDDAGKVTLRKVRIALDLGKQLDLSEGVAPGERIVSLPPEDLVDGEIVKPVERDPSAKT